MGTCASTETQEMAERRLVELLDKPNGKEVNEKELLELINLWPVLLRKEFDFVHMDRKEETHFPLEVVCHLDLSHNVLMPAHHFYPRATRRALIYCKSLSTMEYLLEKTPSSLVEWEGKRGRMIRKRMVRSGSKNSMGSNSSINSTILDGDDALPLHEIIQDERLTPNMMETIVAKAPVWALKRQNEKTFTPLHIICNRDDRTECAKAISLYLDRCPKSVVIRAKGGYTALWYLLVDQPRIPFQVMQLFVDRWPDLFNVPADNGKTPLEAAMLGTGVTPEFVDYVLEKHPDAMIQTYRSGRTLLHMACIRSDARVVQLLLEKGPGAMEVQDDFGETPLFCACANQGPEPVRTMMKVKGALETRSRLGYHALFAACRNHDPDVVELLLQEAPHLACTRGDDWLPLLYACCHNAPVKTIRMLLEAFPSAAGETDPEGRTTLHIACMHDADEMARELLAAEPLVVVARTHKKKWLPLHAACYHAASWETISHLVKVYGEATQEPDSEGRLPLHLACQEVRSTEAIRAMIDCHPQAMHHQDMHGRTPLHMACRNDVNDAIVETLLLAEQELLEPRAATTKNLKQMWTPLHYACYFDASCRTVQLLLDAYPEGIKEEDSEGLTPFQLACKRTIRVNTIRLLLEANPDAVHEMDDGGRTVVHLACQNRELKAMEIIELLLERNPNLVSKRTIHEDWYPLHQACFHNTSVMALSIVEYLLEKHPLAATHADYEERTPLHLICRNQGTCPDADAIVQLLVDRFPQALRHKRTKDGWLPLHYACVYNASVSSIRYILEGYPDAAKTPDDTEKTPLQWAWSRHEQKEQIELMMCRLVPEALHVKDEEGNRKFWKTKIRMESKMREVDSQSNNFIRRSSLILAADSSFNSSISHNST